MPLPWPRGMDRLCYGGDYNPEQWPAETWAEDVALMRRAGVTLVTVGVFSWARLEPEQGRYDFDWLDTVMDLLHDAGVAVNLATPTASPPPWFTLAYPDAMPVTADGVRLWHGSRDTYCLSAPAYRQAAIRVAEAVAGRYRDHPALAMWHVHNEYGTWCYCDHVAAAFRAWLRRRYGELEALNAAWYASFWSQRYSAWQQVMPPRATQYLPNPAHVLDFRRFISDELLDRFREQRDLLRRVTPDVPITTNFMLGEYSGLDNWRWARELDLVAIDHYPSRADADAEAQTAFAADLARSWGGGRPWLLMEQATSFSLPDRITPKQPGRLIRHSLAHLARGSEGVMFFQWRASRAGAEVHHAAMVPHAGADSRIYREVTELGGIVERLAEVKHSTVTAQAAILWDAEAWWAVASPSFPARVDYLDAVRAAHSALYRAGIVTDFAHPADDLSRYRLVLVPSLYLVTDAAAANLGRYLHAGGHLVISFFSGIADEHHRVRLGGHPGAFRDLLGIRVEEFCPLADDEQVRLSTGQRGRFWSERLRTEGADVLADYAGGPLDGLPAITRHRYGSGTASYLSTRLHDADHDRFLAGAARDAGLAPPVTGAAPGVEVVRRCGRDASWLFAINHSDDPQRLPAHGVDLLSGAPVEGVLHLPPGATAVIREPGP